MENFKCDFLGDFQTLCPKYPSFIFFANGYQKVISGFVAATVWPMVENGWLTCGRICTSMTSCCSSESGSGRPAETVVSPVVFISPLRWRWLLERWLPTWDDKLPLLLPLGWLLECWGCWRMLQKSKQSINICVNPHQIAKSVTNQLPWQHDGKAPLDSLLDLLKEQFWAFWWILRALKSPQKFRTQGCSSANFLGSLNISGLKSKSYYEISTSWCHFLDFLCFWSSLKAILGFLDLWKKWK